MAGPTFNFDELNDKLEALLRKNQQLQTEIDELRIAMEHLAGADAGMAKPKVEAPVESLPGLTTPPPVAQKAEKPTPKKDRKPLFDLTEVRRANLEKFIGENLINKIGIVIVVIGVAIGAKYAIDHELINPLTRIILGYLAGLVLAALAFRLKAQYHNFSAVLLSGSMAVLYFITYAAHDFYRFIPQAPAFLLLVAFTAFTVLAAVHYNRVVIAHIGLVGAYAVPFLLGKDPGQAGVLFTYIAVINSGVLTVAVQRYWKSLYYAAFVLTWLIYGFWYLESYQTDKHFGLGMAFNSVFFALFYLTFLAYKLLRKKKFTADDVLALLANAFLFFGFGYAMLDRYPGGGDFLGAFALVNAVIHFGVSTLIHRDRLADRNLFFLVAGLVLVFITIAIPIQLDGDWVTLLWAGEAALLFWLGRNRRAPVYEWLSYPVMMLAFISLLHDWSAFYGGAFLIPGEEEPLPPFFNIHLLTSLLTAAAFGLMSFQNFRRREDAPARWAKTTLAFFLPAILLIVLFFSFLLEIDYFWSLRHQASEITLTAVEGDYTYSQWDDNLFRFGNIWQLNYAMLFLALLSLANIRWWKSELFALLNLMVNFLALVAFLAGGLYDLGGLWESYQDQTLAEYYSRGSFHLWFRYVSFACVAFLIFANHWYLRKMPALSNLRVLIDIVFHLTLLWIASDELVRWLDWSGTGASNKLALSILWGVYAFVLVGIGIWKKRPHLRIGAIVLFAVTLGKLFFYDLAGLDNVSKTIIFVSLGSLLLIISFLYNKYRHAIFDENED